MRRRTRQPRVRPTHFPHGAELLLLCARTRASTAQLDRIRVFADEVRDWPWLLRTAQAHGILPLLADNLASAQSSTVPPHILDQLRAYLAGIALRNQALMRELLRLLRAFDEIGIPAIPYKGPLLALGVYGDLRLRSFGDLDLLIRSRDVQSVAAKLLADDYRLDPPFVDSRQVAFVRGLRTSDLASYLDSRAEHHFIRADGRVLVDLHTALADRFIRFPLTPERGLARAETVVIDGQAVRSLCAEDLLLALCLNGAKDCWNRLGRLSDIAELLRSRPDLNCELVVQRAAQLGAGRILRVSLRLAEELLETWLPATFRNLPTDPVAENLVDHVSRGLFDASERPPLLSAAYSRFALRTRERLRDRLWYCLYLACTPGVADWMWIALPPGVRCLYYLLRPVRLAWRYGLARQTGKT